MHQKKSDENNTEPNKKELGNHNFNMNTGSTGKYEQVIENFSCDVDTTYETVSGNQAKVTHKIGKVQMSDFFVENLSKIQLTFI